MTISPFRTVRGNPAARCTCDTCEDNPWHRGDMPGDHRFPYGGDGLRYAIAIQQLRDDGDFALADAACALVKAMRFDVGKAKDRTVVSGERTMTL